MALLHGRPRQQSWWESSSSDGRIQEGSQKTYRDGSCIFVKTDGGLLNVEIEVWDGPVTRVKMFSKDGRTRPMNNSRMTTIRIGGGLP